MSQLMHHMQDWFAQWRHRRRMQPWRNTAYVYAVPLMLIAMSWMYWYAPNVPIHWTSYFSAMLLLFMVFITYLWLDHRLYQPGIRFCLAGGVNLFAAYMVVDAYLLHLTSIRLHHAITVLHTGGDFLTTLEQAGFTPRRLIGIGGIMLIAFIGGGIAHLILPRLPLGGRWSQTIIILSLLMASCAFVFEQSISRSRNDYHVRSLILPGYLALFQDGIEGFTASMPSPKTQDQRRLALQQVGQPARQVNVVYILLESVNTQVIDDGYMPNLQMLAADGVNFRQAMAAGSHTHLAWNTLLLDRPAAMFWQDFYRPPDTMGSFPLELLRSAGYDMHASISTLFNYKGFARRVKGETSLFDQYFQAVDPTTELGRVALWNTAEKDAEATDVAVRWIESFDRQQPFFLMLNYDATHFPYHFPQEARVVENYLSYEGTMSGFPDIPALYRRYCNAAYGVDLQIGRIIDALKRAGLYDNTAIVAVSDHGEGFEVGALGRGQLVNVVRQVPMIMRLPGIEPRDVEQIVGHQELWPTLFDYLDIEGVDDSLFLGRSALSDDFRADGALTMAANMQTIDLTTRDYVLRMRVKYSEHQMTFFPVQAFSRADQPIPDCPQTFAQLASDARQRITHLLKDRPATTYDTLVQADAGQPGEAR